MYDAIEFRGNSQADVEELAAHAGVPVYNGLTNEWHPTQMLADFLTMHEASGSTPSRPYSSPPSDNRTCGAPHGRGDTFTPRRVRKPWRARGRIRSCHTINGIRSSDGKALLGHGEPEYQDLRRHPG
jgi:hypothetical protein